jgi:hypothetical protein
LVGFLVWFGLLTALGPPSTKLVAEDGRFVVRPAGYAEVAITGAVYGLVWGFVGFVVGCVSILLRSFRVPIIALIGALVGGAICAATSPADGWLSLTIPVYSFTGTLVALLLGVILELTLWLWSRFRLST